MSLYNTIRNPAHTQVAVLINPKMEKNKKHWYKYTLGLATCFLIRFIPFRPPNIEPVLATQMPFAKEFGKSSGFFFGFLSIILYDIAVSKTGVWTLITALAYGLLGIWATTYFKNKNGTTIEYAKFAIMSTIVYDIVTGLSIGPIFFGQSFMQALVGQIPFTALHLMGNITFAVFLSPVIQELLIKNKLLENKFFIKNLKLKQI